MKLIISNNDLLGDILDDILADKVCPELRDSAIQLVFGDGNVDTDIVLIGEAPGKKEDETGVPFVGAAGKFLSEMLQLIGLSREDVYITNIVKYRPPNNRDPKPDEKEAFWPYLVRQLDVIKPKLVVTLGRHSMEYFLPGAKINEVHGEPQSVSIELKDGSKDYVAIKTTILPLYHPAAALYNGGMRQALKDDFSKIPKILSKI